MKKHILSLSALLLALSMLAACTARLNTSSLPNAELSESVTRASHTTVPSLTSVRTTALTSALSTNAVTSAPPVTEAPTELQAVLADTPRDAAYLSVYDYTNDKLLFTSGEDQQIYPASTTKLFTILYALTVVDAEEVFKVGEEIKIAPSDSSKAWIAIDQKFTVRDLVAAMLLPSGNDAAYTLAVGCGRALTDDRSLTPEDALALFMQGMNAYADALGLSGTHFVTPDGYHDPEHYTTLADMTKIACLAYENELISEIMAMPSYTAIPLNFGEEKTWKNTNLLLSEESDSYLASVNGMKTGFHSDAGVCLIASAEQNGRTLILLLFKGSDKMGRFAEAKTLFELCFATLEA